MEDEIQRFAKWLGQLDVVPTIAALRRHGDEIVDELLAENANRWESLSEKDRERVVALAHAVAQRLLHEPTLRMKADRQPRAAAAGPRAVRPRRARARRRPPSRPRTWSSSTSAVKIATRGSALALAQASWVAERLPGEHELVTVRTSGDRGEGPDDKARWVDAVERALLDGEADLAVHSAKDVPAQLAPGTVAARLAAARGPARRAAGRAAARRAGRHVVAAPARAAARRPRRHRGRRPARQRGHAAAQARRGRGRRGRPRDGRAARASAAPRARRRWIWSRPPARARWRCRRSRAPRRCRSRTRTRPHA